MGDLGAPKRANKTPAAIKNLRKLEKIYIIVHRTPSELRENVEKGGIFKYIGT